MCVGGGPAGDAWGSPRRPGKGPERAAGARGPRAALAFRVSLSTKLGGGRWRAPPSGLPVRQRRRPRGLQRGDRAPYLGYWGQPRVPFLKPGDVCTKNMPRAAVCCPLRGKSFAHRHASAHSSVSPRMCPSASPGCFQAMEHAWHAKRLPRARSGGFPPPDFVPTRREDSSLVINTSQVGQNPKPSAKCRQGPNQAAAFVERIAVEPKNCAEY